MQERRAIDLSGEVCNAIRHDAGAKQNLLIAKLKEQESSILEMLVSYHYESRGQVSDLLFEDVTFHDPFSGTFKINYKVNYFVGCSDINFDEKASMTFYFKVDMASHTLELLGENIPERGPDEF